jgi:4-carboxymuconolactone decarboxylase
VESGGAGGNANAPGKEARLRTSRTQPNKLADRPGVFYDALPTYLGGPRRFGMRPTKPRVPPLPEQEWSDEQRELLLKGNPSRVLNIFRTLVRHPGLFRRWTTFGNHVLFKSTLDARARELLILRIGHLCNSSYEFHQHAAIGKRVGLTDAEIEQIKRGPDAPEWSAFDRKLVQAVDELHKDSCIGEATWQALTAHYNTQQMMDLVFTVGQYTLVSMALNSLGVQIETD